MQMMDCAVSEGPPSEGTVQTREKKCQPVGREKKQVEHGLSRHSKGPIVGIKLSHATTHLSKILAFCDLHIKLILMLKGAHIRIARHCHGQTKKLEDESVLH